MTDKKWVLLSYFVDVLYAYLPIGYKRREFNADGVNYIFIQFKELMRVFLFNCYDDP